MAGNMEEALRRIHENKRTQSKILDLSGLGLTELPDELWDCVWVEELGLGRKWFWNVKKEDWIWDDDAKIANRFSSLPNSISKFKHLTRLYLDHNPISEIGVLSSLVNLTNLDLSSASIIDISALSSLANLTKLYLYHNPISEIGVLSSLVNLTNLGLSSASIIDISALSSLANLTKLYLDHNPISEISALSSLVNLTNLSLSLTSISDINALSSLVNLTNLNLSSTSIIDISVLSSLVNLTHLDLMGNPISDISVLNNLVNLTNLSLMDTSISDISVLSSLVNLTHLDLRDNPISDTSVLSSLVNLTHLDLRDNPISDIYALSNLVNLTNLSLRSGSISDISALRSLVNLTNLSLNSSQLSDISVLSNLVNLINLELKAAKLNDINALSSLKHLSRVDLTLDQVVDISMLKNHEHLEHLALVSDYSNHYSSYNNFKKNSFILRSKQIDDISVLSNLVNLGSLELSLYHLQDISVLSNLVNLSSLELSLYHLQDISVLSSLVNLTNLSLNGSKFSDISVLSSLVNLTNLSLNGSKFSDISVLSSLVNLTNLSLRNRSISDISALSSLVNLTNLSLSLTSISDINALSSLVNLTDLYLGSAAISDISALSSLVNLTNLNLSSAAISDISALSSLVNLIDLSLSFTAISDISALSSLVNLIDLDLSFTAISDISPLISLVNLTDLDLSMTNISDISPLSSLVNLTDLNLSMTNVSDICPVNSLKQLTTLKLIESTVPYFPFELLFLPKLEGLHLQDTHCFNLPPELTHKTNALSDLRNYYAELQKNAYTAYDAKLITVGNGRVGKTSLLKALFQRATFNPQENSTHGIQLFTTTLPLPKKPEPANLKLWDFGGQELYHATHRIFMKSRALYLLVWDPHTEQKTGEDLVEIEGQTYIFRNYPLSYWLGNIRALSSHAKIIVVCNKSDDGQERFPDQLSSLQDKYKIDSFISVSACTGYGLSTLRQRIEYVLDQMPEVGMQMPVSWKRVQDQLATLSDHYIDMVQYQRICTAEGLSADSGFTVLRFFHHSGFLFWHEQYLQDQIILDQKWALEAIYQLLDRNGWYPLLKGNALRQRSEIAKCWRDYAPSQVDLFLEMMQSCELALKLEDKQSDNPHYLIPEFLPDTPAPAVADIWEAATGPIFHFRFQHPFFHAALIQRFIVRSAKLAERYDLLWRTGLLIKVDGTMALVQVYPEAGCIDMQLRGANQANLLERLKNEISQIQEVKDNAGFLLSLTGQPNEWVTLDQMQIKKGKHIASTTGEILELAPFLPLLFSPKNSDRDSDHKAPGLKELSDQESGLQLLIPTPPPNPLEGLKLLVKQALINEGIGAAITCLETYLHTDSTPATDLIVISSQFQAFNRNVAKGIHSFDEQQLLSNRITNQVVALLTTIQETDLK